MRRKKKTFYMECVNEAKKSVPEDSRIHPKVGVIAVKSGKIIGRAHRGEIAKGDHAEYTLLERKFNRRKIKDSKIYLTLEPCMDRTLPKIPCAERIIQRGIKKIYVGMLDPNPKIWGNGVWLLNKNGVKIDYFPRKYREQIITENKDFIKEQARRFDEFEFRRVLPKTFIDPDEPFLDVAYALFRLYRGNTIVVYNTQLQMFVNPNEFYAWWVNGIFENDNIKKIYILAKEDVLNKKLANSPIKDKILQEFENRDPSNNKYLVKSIQKNEEVYAWKGILFMDIRNKNNSRLDIIVDYILSDLEISLNQLIPGISLKNRKNQMKRVMFAACKIDKFTNSFENELPKIYKKYIQKVKNRFQSISQYLNNHR